MKRIEKIAGAAALCLSLNSFAQETLPMPISFPNINSIKISSADFLWDCLVRNDDENLVEIFSDPPQLLNFLVSEKNDAGELSVVRNSEVYLNEELDLRAIHSLQEKTHLMKVTSAIDKAAKSLGINISSLEPSLNNEKPQGIRDLENAIENIKRQGKFTVVYPKKTKLQFGSSNITGACLVSDENQDKLPEAISEIKDTEKPKSEVEQKTIEDLKPVESAKDSSDPEIPSAFGISLIESHNGPWITPLQFDRGVEQEARSPDGSVRAGYAWGNVIISARNKDGDDFTISTPCDRCYNLVYSQDMRFLAAGGADQVYLFTSRGVLWKSFKLNDIFDGPSFGAHLSFSPDGKLLAVESSRHLAFIDVDQWKVLSKTKVIIPEGMQYRGAHSGKLSFSSDGNHLKIIMGFKNYRGNQLQIAYYEILKPT